MHLFAIIFGIVGTLVMVLADRLVKMWAVANLQPVGTMPLIPGFIGLRYVENTGAAFSMLQGRQIFLIALTTVALLAVAFVLFIRRPKDKLEVISLTMLLGGGIGNYIDRIVRGYVVDCFEFQFMNFAVFNVADIFVVVGVCLLLLAFILQEVRDRKQKKLAAGNTAQETTDAS
jgi:signal peptidase II